MKAILRMLKTLESGFAQRLAVVQRDIEKGQAARQSEFENKCESLESKLTLILAKLSKDETESPIPPITA